MDPPVLPNPSPGVARAMADIDAFLAEVRAHVEAARRRTLAMAGRRATVDAQFPGLLNRRARTRLVRGHPRPCRN